MAQTFLQAVNRVLRISGIIRGDTDPVALFSDLQHGATLNIAILAIQSTLTDLTAYYEFPKERTSGSITLATNTRTYALAADFVQFWNNPGFFYDATQNFTILEFGGGEQRLARVIFDYKTQYGYPNEWYYVDGDTKQVGFYQVPDASVNGRILTYDYEKDVIPLVETDVMPFIRDIEVFAFCELASVKFNAMFSQQPKQPGLDIQKDPNYVSARASLLKLIRPTKPSKRYGRSFTL